MWIGDSLCVRVLFEPQRRKIHEQNAQVLGPILAVNN